MPRLLICMQIIYLQTKLAIYHNNLFYSASIDKWQKSGKNVRDQIFVCCHSLVLVWMYGRWYQWNCWNNIWSSFLIIIFFPVITRCDECWDNSESVLNLTRLGADQRSPEDSIKCTTIWLAVASLCHLCPQRGSCGGSQQRRVGRGVWQPWWWRSIARHPLWHVRKSLCGLWSFPAPSK